MGTVSGSSFLLAAQQTLVEKRIKTERDAPASLTPAAPALSGVGAVKKEESKAPSVGLTPGVATPKSEPTPGVRYVGLSALTAGMSSQRHAAVKREEEAGARVHPEGNPAGSSRSLTNHLRLEDLSQQSSSAKLAASMGRQFSWKIDKPIREKRNWTDHREREAAEVAYQVDWLMHVE